jgi:hypothetical protein
MEVVAAHAEMNVLLVYGLHLVRQHAVGPDVVAVHCARCTAVLQKLYTRRSNTDVRSAQTTSGRDWTGSRFSLRFVSWYRVTQF